MCKVRATYGLIEAGDLPTSSAAPDHAMKAGDRGRAFSAVVGKARVALQWRAPEAVDHRGIGALDDVRQPRCDRQLGVVRPAH
jgi:hypothetical protein